MHKSYRRYIFYYVLWQLSRSLQKTQINDNVYFWRKSRRRSWEVENHVHNWLISFLVICILANHVLNSFRDRQFWSDRQFCLNERILFNRWRVKVTLFANWNLEKYTSKWGNLIPTNDEDRIGLHLFFSFFLQLAKNVLNNMGQSKHALNFHIEVIVGEHWSTFIFWLDPLSFAIWCWKQ